MIPKDTLNKLEKEGEKTIVFTVGVDLSHNNTLAVTKLNELCELDMGVEIHRTTNNNVPVLKYQGKKQTFDVVYTTPACKEYAEAICERDSATLVMLFDE